MKIIDDLIRNNLISRKCLCGHNHSVRLYNKDRYGFDLNFVFCLGCGLIRMNPTLSKMGYYDFYTKYYKKFYSEDELWNSDESMKDIFSIQRETGKYILDILRNNLFSIKGKTVLEVGCSIGGTLYEFQQCGAEVYGFDLNSHYIEYGKSRGLDIELGRMDLLCNKNMKFDIIILYHVIEHLSNPFEDMRFLRQYLKEENESIVFIATPGLFNLIRIDSFHSLFHIAHPFLFSKRTLTNMMIDAGYRAVLPSHEIVSIYTPSNKLPPKNNSMASRLFELSFAKLAGLTPIFNIGQNFLRRIYG